MHLTLTQVAQLFSVSENVIARWIRQENMPAQAANSQYRFNRAELLEWAAANRHPFSSNIFQEINGDHVQELSLADALERGGVGMRVSGSDRYEVFRNAVSGFPQELRLDHELLLDLLIAREKAGGTAVGGGIAIPHPRYPVVVAGNASLVRVCYLAEPLAYTAGDGQSIDTLFLMICPTVHEHLQLLARLSSVLHSNDFRTLLHSKPDKTRLLSALRAAEESRNNATEAIS